MITYADTDVVVVGAGCARLSCAYELSKNPNVQPEKELQTVDCILWNVLPGMLTLALLSAFLLVKLYMRWNQRLPLKLHA
ncbi:thiamine thiazole synthase, chloroplastic-like protein [Tanacetum coccineum]